MPKIYIISKKLAKEYIISDNQTTCTFYDLIVQKVN